MANAILRSVVTVTVCVGLLAGCSKGPERGSYLATVQDQVKELKGQMNVVVPPYQSLEKDPFHTFADSGAIKVTAMLIYIGKDRVVGIETKGGYGTYREGDMVGLLKVKEIKLREVVILDEDGEEIKIPYGETMAR